uniref:Uncharacterized protein n=1 Tax=Meloidogyne hapla TaxID=6305 RepID=A0A1I8BFD9_MELHA
MDGRGWGNQRGRQSYNPGKFSNHQRGIFPDNPAVRLPQVHPVRPNLLNRYVEPRAPRAHWGGAHWPAHVNPLVDDQQDPAIHQPGIQHRENEQQEEVEIDVNAPQDASDQESENNFNGFNNIGNQGYVENQRGSYNAHQGDHGDYP